MSVATASRKARSCELRRVSGRLGLIVESVHDEERAGPGLQVVLEPGQRVQVNWIGTQRRTQHTTCIDALWFVGSSNRSSDGFTKRARASASRILGLLSVSTCAMQDALAANHH
jgi:hypothetical protein